MASLMEHQASALWTCGIPLLAQECVEHGLFDVDLVRAAVRVDEGVLGTILELRVLFFKIVLGRMIAKRHVASERTSGNE
jgi:hypothetical protein